MTSFEADLLAEFDRDLANGARLVIDDYVPRVRKDPATPHATGKLAAGIQADEIVDSPGRARTSVKSTYRSPQGADVGTILDQSTGKEVTAKSKGHRAFGPFAKPVSTRGGSTRYLGSFKVTTKHVGWWEKANDEAHWRAAAEQLAKVNL